MALMKKRIYYNRIIVLLATFGLLLTSCNSAEKEFDGLKASSIHYLVESFSLRLGEGAMTSSATVEGASPFTFSIASIHSDSDTHLLDINAFSIDLNSGVVNLKEGNSLQSNIYLLDIAVSNSSGTSIFPKALEFQIENPHDRLNGYWAPDHGIGYGITYFNNGKHIGYNVSIWDVISPMSEINYELISYKYLEFGLDDIQYEYEFFGNDQMKFWPVDNLKNFTFFNRLSEEEFHSLLERAPTDLPNSFEELMRRGWKMLAVEIIDLNESGNGLLFNEDGTASVINKIEYERPDGTFYSMYNKSEIKFNFSIEKTYSESFKVGLISINGTNYIFSFVGSDTPQYEYYNTDCYEVILSDDGSYEIRITGSDVWADECSTMAAAQENSLNLQ